MTFRTLHGIPFRVRSPSHYEIDGSHTPESWIDLCAVSFECDRAWHVSVLMKQGHSIHRGPFRSLDEAVRLIAGQTRGVA